MSSIVLDQVLFELLMEEESRTFTILQLRKAYVDRVNLNGIQLPRLRVYIYDQVRRLERVGWVKIDEEKKKRNQLFHFLPKPKHVKVNTRLPSLGMKMKLLFSTTDLNKINDLEKRKELKTFEFKDKDGSTNELESKLAEAKLDLLVAQGETESYKQIIDDMPELGDRLSSDLLKARDNSSKLLGRVRAIETAIKRLEVSP